MKNEMKAKIQNMLELPAEILKDSYRMTIVDDTNLLIENYKSIIEYENCIIRLSCGISILGENLSVLEISVCEIVIVGKIKNIEFE